jgi:hypothetical protein
LDDLEEDYIIEKYILKNSLMSLLLSPFTIHSFKFSNENLKFISKYLNTNL